ncbi:hypothetical protein PG987_009849 [Apiospora arundinis]
MHKGKGIRIFALACMAPLVPALGSNGSAGLQWGECDDAGWRRCPFPDPRIDRRQFQCAQIDVPMDHFSESSDKKFTIPLIRKLGANASATGDRHILYNPGGPGLSGMDAIRCGGTDMHIKYMLEDFHLLGFDPRGVGDSKPTALCQASDAPRIKDPRHENWNLEFQAGEMYAAAENRAKACRDAMGEHGEYINTPQTAADMNSILEAIGQQQMYFWGTNCKIFSVMHAPRWYQLTSTDGTVLGQTYAQMYPDRVARLVLDSVVDLEKWYNDFYFTEDTLLDLDRGFAGFVDECFQAGEACTLHSVVKRQNFESASQLKAYIDDYLERLDEEPIPVYLDSADYGLITRTDVVRSGIIPPVYYPKIWPQLGAKLAALLNGANPAAYAAFTKAPKLERHRDDAFSFVLYNDALHSGPEAPLQGMQSIRDYTLERTETSYLFSRYWAFLIYQAAAWKIPTTHDFRPSTTIRPPPLITAEPILILSPTWDPGCPLVYAQRAQASFEGAALVEQTSYGQGTASMDSRCTMAHVRRYFTEGVLPEPGTVCSIDVEYFPKPKNESFIAAMPVIRDAGLLEDLEPLEPKGGIVRDGPGSANE